MSKRDYYDVLGVDQRASLDEIKSSYRKIAIKNHPDKNPGDEQAELRFKEATEAYEVLSNEEKRRAYDQFGFAGVQGEYGDARNYSSAFRDFDDIFGNFSNIFDFFGGSRTTSARSGERYGFRGEDVDVSIRVDFRTLVFGGDIELEYTQKTVCSACSGTRVKAGSRATTCTECGGSGQVRRSSGLFSIATVCSVCEGRGSVIKEYCRECSGAGLLGHKRKRRITIPAGIEAGTYLTIRGEGHHGTDGSRGDVNIHLDSKPHPYFERRNQDLYCTVPVTISQAVLGSDIFIQTLDDKKLKIKIPAGSQNGKLLRIKGAGVPHHNMRSKQGDLYVELCVTIPKSLRSAEERALFADLARLEPENSHPEPVKRIK